MSKYFEICKGVPPDEISVEVVNGEISKYYRHNLTAQRISEDSFEIVCNYKSGLKQKKFTINYCLIVDIANLWKIWQSEEPRWADPSTKLVKGEIL